MGSGVWGIRGQGEPRWGSVEKSGLRLRLAASGKVEIQMGFRERDPSGVDPVGYPVRGSSAAEKVGIQVGLGLVAVSSVHKYLKL